MRISHVVFCLCCFVFSVTKSQFFTKTGGNSIPRMGRSQHMLNNMHDLPNLVRRVAHTLRLAIEMVNRYDEDGNGELNAEELMGIPFIQNVVRNSFQDKEVQELENIRNESNQNSGMNNA